MADEGDRLYTRRHIERLIDGWNYSWSLDATGPRPRWIYIAEPREIDPDPHAMWAGLLSGLEETGNLGTDAAMIVMDLERALHLLSRRHPDAASVISARMMCDFEDDEMDLAFPQVRGRGGKVVRADWRRLRDRAVAWFSTYLRGGTIEQAERAYKAAR
jgi:hypothetical protein